MASCTGWSSGGDTLIVIEHNVELMVEADYLIDLGPSGGKDGGQIVLSDWLVSLSPFRAPARSATYRALGAWWDRFGSE